MSTDLGIQAEWLLTHMNTIADDISRLSDENDDHNYSQLLIDHPSLINCRNFQPSDTLLGMIWDILLKNESSDPLIVRKLKLHALSSLTSLVS